MLELLGLDSSLVLLPNLQGFSLPIRDETDQHSALWHDCKGNPVWLANLCFYWSPWGLFSEPRGFRSLSCRVSVSRIRISGVGSFFANFRACVRIKISLNFDHCHVDCRHTKQSTSTHLIDLIGRLDSILWAVLAAVSTNKEWLCVYDRGHESV